MTKHKYPIYTPSRIVLFLIIAAMIGFITVLIAIFLNDSPLRGSVVEVMFGLDCQPRRCSLNTQAYKYGISLLLVITAGFAYGLIQQQLLQALFHIHLRKWHIWTTLGSLMGFITLFIWETLYNYELLEAIEEIVLGTLFFENFSPWYTFWLLLHFTPIAIIQAIHLNRRFQSAWLLPFVHIVGSIVYGLAAHPASTYEVSLSVYLIAALFGLSIAICLLWIIRQPKFDLNIV